MLFACPANVAPAAFLSHFTVFALSCVVGYYVVWNVSHALHTPLMSVTNAISGIIVVGALLQIGHGGWVTFGFYRRADRQHQYLRRFHRDSAHAENVP